MPRVTKHEEIDACIGIGRPSLACREPCVVHDARLGAALKELAHMCGAFLQATMSHPGTTSPAGTTRVRIDAHVGDALDFYDALLAVPPTAGGPQSEAATPRRSRRWHSSKRHFYSQ